ncbi:MAG: asparagine--tRNA ligase [Spirochaetaceae bacterium]|jgi:asparaginyl-tRNA synthetase|nr:asparagine--tRNA ligase [Spirochaetaceae bacterium]
MIKDLLTEEPCGQHTVTRGWVRTKRTMKNLVFIEVYDGSCFAALQCTFDRTTELSIETQTTLDALSTGASVEISGKLVSSPAQGQCVELAADEARLIGAASGESYPLQKKGHSFEFLREIAHLRPRTATIGAVARIRSRLAYAVHTFFQEQGFQYVHTPIITTNDAEGTGAMFQITTLDLAKITAGTLDYSKDFFGKKAFLTVSGQLEGETYAAALSRIYTFGPTFRAENSNTSRHLAEFWMIEPEIAFAHLEDDMALAEKFIKYLFTDILDKHSDDLEFFDTHIEKGLIATLQSVADSRFTHITYTDAIRELEHHAANFEFKPFWGCDLQSEHEKFLTEQLAHGPVIVTDYPKEIKAFYMKTNSDGKTVRAMDVLVPRLGEIIGGSEREDDLEQLQLRMRELGMDIPSYWWYLDLRRFGSVPHAGFGLGFERLVQYVTGMANIRDVIPYPRAAGQAEF